MVFAEQLTALAPRPDIPPALGAGALQNVIGAEAYSTGPLPDAVVEAMTASNGVWPQLNGPETIALANAVLDMIEAGEIESWEAFSRMDGITHGQATMVATELNRYHEAFKINHRVVDEQDQPDVHPVTFERLAELLGGRKDQALTSIRTFYQLTLRGHEDEPLEQLQARRAGIDRTLSILWRTAQAALNAPDKGKMSIIYKQRIGRIYADPSLRPNEKDLMVDRLKRSTSNALRDPIILAALAAAGTETDNPALKSAVTAWAREAFMMSC